MVAMGVDGFARSDYAFAIVGVTVTDSDDGSGGHTDRRGGDDYPGSRDEHAGSRNDYPGNRYDGTDTYELGLCRESGTG